MNLLKNLRNKVYLGLMWVLVLIPETASSETWDRNLDLTIPSLETPSTWVLDSKAKQEIMMGFECCYHNSLLEQVRNEAFLKSIQFQSKEKPSVFKFSPSKETLRYFYIVNALDVLTTHHGIKSGKAKEANPLLPNSPNIGELVLFKVVWGKIVLETFDNDELKITNGIVTIAVINNLYVLHNIDEL